MDKGCKPTLVNWSGAFENAQKPTTFLSSVLRSEFWNLFCRFVSLPWQQELSVSLCVFVAPSAGAANLLQAVVFSQQIRFPSSGAAGDHRGGSLGLMHLFNAVAKVELGVCYPLSHCRLSEGDAAESEFASHRYIFVVHATCELSLLQGVK
jgi:hypothetical protein